MKSKHGFTLVELIVVIAIIAILAAVSIVGFTRYIANARWSNDQSVAAQMDDIINYHLVGKTDVTLDAHDVRTIIDLNHGQSFDMTPTTRDAGFFYIDGRVIVEKFEVIEDPSYQLSFHPKAILLSENDHLLEGGIVIGETPEELFGSGKVLLSTSGHIVCEVVHALRNLGTSSTFEDDFDDLETMVTSMGDGLFGDDTHQDRLNALLDEFDPAHTLYVGDTGWRYQGTDSEHIGWTANRVVMAAGITNIPSYTGPRTTVLEDITIPRSVKTIENNAFASLRNHPSLDLDFHMPADVTINVEANAFSSDQKSRLSLSEGIQMDWVVPTLDIKVYLGDTLIDTDVDKIDRDDVGTEEGQSLLTFNIESIDRGSIITMTGSFDGDTYTVRFYSELGLIGIKTVQFE